MTFGPHDVPSEVDSDESRAQLAASRRNHQAGGPPLHPTDP
jgi:hypothetical protein